ncbi:MAG: GntR family transcriptional regulator [Gammaproteobacteria bacterium]|jgi:DNA-binding GntR family transcriptional regulator
MTSSTAKRNSASATTDVPKYTAVATELVEEIRAGKYVPGDLLPSEPELTRRFGVSRHTVRAALRSLYEKGLVVSQRGRGTIVQDAAVAPRYSHACDTVEDVLQYAAATPRRVVSCRRLIVDEALGEQLGCAAGYPWWEIHTSRQRDPGGPVVASSLIWVPDEFADAVAAIETSDEPLFVVIGRMHGCNFAEIRQAVSVAMASTREARDLDIPPGTAVMCVERHFIDERGGLLEVSRTVHPPESYCFEMKLRRVIGA